MRIVTVQAAPASPLRASAAARGRQRSGATKFGIKTTT
jgi:hypothetical protein